MNAGRVLSRLVACLDHHRSLAIAVSGGVDSMMLAHVAHHLSRAKAVMYHAHGPAVPLLARERVEEHASRYGWNLVLIDARELEDSRYRKNPVDRCYYCKTNLYTRIRKYTSDPVASGTNTDDLSDYRPGLVAAEENGVIHPFVEAGVDKRTIYEFARMLGFSDLERLPAQPCLASRIETGIVVSRADLEFIDEVESELRVQLGEGEVVRCRVTALGVLIELSAVEDPNVVALANSIGQRACHEHNRKFSGLRPYRRGSAFVRKSGNE